VGNNADHEQRERRRSVGRRLRDIAEEAVEGSGKLDHVELSITVHCDYEQDEDEREKHRREHDGDEHDGDHDGDKPGAGGRPGKTVGTSRGSLDGTPVTIGDVEGKHPIGTWPGPRKDLFLPFLFHRANSGDTGTRPVVGPFWESPDIYLLAGVLPQDAPDVPAELGQTALANAPNTVYAHVWNFGKSAAREVVVEFYWLDPALGITGGGTHLIGQAFTTLGSRYSGHSHAVVKCPEAWEAKYANGGHECLIVRSWDVSSDALSTPEWDASVNRHVAQRNIHVIPASELGSAPPLMLKVGPLFGAPATVRVERTQPSSMSWLQLHTGARGQFPAPAAPTGMPLLSPPSAIGGSPKLGPGGQHQHVAGDDQQVGLTTTDSPPSAGQAHVYRVTANQGGQTVGGYTVVVTG
jgi:hypothetical protein